MPDDSPQPTASKDFENLGQDLSFLEDQLIGKTLASRYKINSIIGNGGFGRVYLGEHLTLEIPIAIKVIHQHIAQDQDRLKRLDQEAKILSRLNSEFIVKTMDFGLSPVAYLVMEYVPGSTLSSFLKDEQINDSDGLEIFEQICKGLAAAHKIGLVHRDLKPGNILISRRPHGLHCKILDFGIAKIVEDTGSSEKLTATGEILGSPAYMSPEQWMAGKVDGRSDIYSLACVMYEVLTGVPVFQAATSYEYLNLHIQQDFTQFSKAAPNRRISPELEKVVMKCAQKDPAHRYQTTEEILEDLSKIRSGHKLNLKLRKNNVTVDRKQGKIPVVVGGILLTGLIGSLSFAGITHKDDLLSSACMELEKNAQKQERAGKFEEAISTLKNAMIFADMLPKQDKERLQVMRAQVSLMKEHGSFAESSALEKKLRTEIGDIQNASITRTMSSAINLLEVQRLPTQAIRQARAATTMAAQYGKHTVLNSTCMRHLGAIYREARQLKAAEKILDEALTIAEDLLDPLDQHISSILNELGLSISRQGRHAEGERAFLRAIKIGEAVKDPQLARYYNNLSAAYLYQKQPEKALEAVKRACELEIEAGGDKASNMMNNMGTIYYHLKQYDKSIDAYHKTMELWKKDGVDHERSGEETLFNLAMTYKAKKDYDNALLWCNKALVAREKVDPQNELIGRINKEIALIKQAKEKDQSLNEAEESERGAIKPSNGDTFAEKGRASAR